MSPDAPSFPGPDPLAPQIDAMLAELKSSSPAAMTALWVAGRLPVDSIPWAWLESFTIAHHPELAAQGPEAWSSVRGVLEGRRLLVATATPEFASIDPRVGDRVEQIYDRALFDRWAPFVIRECGRVDGPGAEPWLVPVLVDASLRFAAAPDDVQRAVTRILPAAGGIVDDASVATAMTRALGTFRHRVAQAPAGDRVTRQDLALALLSATSLLETLPPGVDRDRVAAAIATPVPRAEGAADTAVDVALELIRALATGGAPQL